MNIDQWYNSYLQKTHQYTGRAPALGSALLTAFDVSRPRARWVVYILSRSWSCVKELLHFRDFHTGCGMHYAHRWLHRAAPESHRGRSQNLQQVSESCNASVHLLHTAVWSCSVPVCEKLLHMSKTVFPFGLHTDTMESSCYTVHRKTPFLHSYLPCPLLAACLCGFSVQFKVLIRFHY